MERSVSQYVIAQSAVCKRDEASGRHVMECDGMKWNRKKRVRNRNILFPQLSQPFEMEVDASAIAIGAVLNQKGEDGKTHPVAYYSESFSAPERNYDIYDRELLAIVKALRQLRTYLLGSPHQITIYTDHSNLQYWKEPQKINQRVAREFQELSEYDFILKHIPGMTNTRADALSRQLSNNKAKEDNDNVIVLPHEVFANATYTSLNEIDTQC